jgi:hypothetical protein
MHAWIRRRETYRTEGSVNILFAQIRSCLRRTLGRKDKGFGHVLIREAPLDRVPERLVPGLASPSLFICKI